MPTPPSWVDTGLHIAYCTGEVARLCWLQSVQNLIWVLQLHPTSDPNAQTLSFASARPFNAKSCSDQLKYWVNTLKDIVTHYVQNLIWVLQLTD